MDQDTTVPSEGAATVQPGETLGDLGDVNGFTISAHADSALWTAHSLEYPDDPSLVRTFPSREEAADWAQSMSDRLASGRCPRLIVSDQRPAERDAALWVLSRLNGAHVLGLVRRGELSYDALLLGKEGVYGHNSPLASWDVATAPSFTEKLPQSHGEAVFSPTFVTSNIGVSGALELARDLSKAYTTADHSPGDPPDFDTFMRTVLETDSGQLVQSAVDAHAVLADSAMYEKSAARKHYEAQALLESMRGTPGEENASREAASAEAEAEAAHRDLAAAANTAAQGRGEVAASVPSIASAVSNTVRHADRAGLKVSGRRRTDVRTPAGYVR